MTLFGIDYAAGPANIAQLKAANVGFVFRYIAPPGTVYDWKRAGKAEVHNLLAAGIAVGLVFESSANRALGGAPAGHQDALWAEAELKRLGAPAKLPVCFAIDFDAKDYDPRDPESAATARKKLGPIASYFASIGSTMGLARTGGYGGFYPIERLFDAGLITIGWQTFAWSGGQWEGRAQVRQVKNGQKLAGVSCDYDAAVHPSFGVWHPAQPKPKPNPNPKPDPNPTPQPDPSGWPAPTVLSAIVQAADGLRKDQGYWAWRSWRLGEAGWKPWGPQNDIVRPDVAPRIPKKWWQRILKK